MTLIFFFSQDSSVASTKKSDTVILDAVELLTHKKVPKSKREYYIDKYVFIVRKLAHFSIYLLLGILVFSLFKEYKYYNYKGIIYSIIIILLYAISDEVHQLFIPGRSSEVRDVLIDTIGGTTGIIIYYYYRRFIQWIKNAN